MLSSSKVKVNAKAKHLRHVTRVIIGLHPGTKEMGHGQVRGFAGAGLAHLTPDHKSSWAALSVPFGL